jgi:hypothetical protein
MHKSITYKKNSSKSHFKISFIAAACLFANVSSYASRASYTNRSSPLEKKNLSEVMPLPLRIFIDGAMNNPGFLYGDVLTPVFGNGNGFAFLNVTAKDGTDKGYLGAFGAGLRQIWQGAIFGGYLFTEYDRTVFGNNFWTLNPGLEAITPRWDFHINGYFPLGSKKNVTGVFFGSDLGITCSTFIGRNQFDEVFNSINETARGLDAQIGYIIPHTHRIRIFGAGYYYFFHQAKDLGGGAAGAEIPLTQTISFLFRDSYDNVNKNTALLTIRVYFNTIDKSDENDIHTHLLDPIERHIGVLYTGSGLPAEKALFNTGQLKLLKSNIWFFSPNGTDTVSNANSCTFEHPCVSDQFTPANVNFINNIAPNTNFYLAGGTQVNYPKGPFTINLGQSVYGKIDNFCQIAPFDMLPILNGNLVLQGNNTIQAIMLVNDPITTPGVNITNAANIVIDAIQVGPSLTMTPFAPVPEGSFLTGIDMNNAQNVLITNSIINAGDYQTDEEPKAYGIIAKNSSNFIFRNNNVNVHNSAEGLTTNVIESKSLSTIYFNNVNANLQNNVINMISDGIAIEGNDIYIYTSVINIKDSIISSNANRFGLTAYVKKPSPKRSKTYGYAIKAYGIGNINSIGDNFDLNADTFGLARTVAIGAQSFNNTIITLGGDNLNLNAIVDAPSNGAFATTIGAESFNASIINFNASILNLNAIGNSDSENSFGAQARDTSTINFNSNTLNLKTISNELNIGGLAETSGARSYNGSTINFNDNKLNLSAYANGAGTNAIVIAAESNNTSLINFNANNAYLSAIAKGIGLVTAKAIASDAKDTSTINLNGATQPNAFALKACENGMIGTRTKYSGNVINIPGNTFTFLPC